jgi:lipopolysaccharide/colanic/teichoic acid biosynthesis glycosyltransferase
MTTTAMLLALFLAIVGPCIADEVKAWSSWLPQKLRRMAVAKLPEKLRDRYNEEWERGIEEIPGQLFKLLYSFDLLRASVRIRSAAQESAGKPETRFTSLKRIFDIAFSGFMLIAILPVMLIIAIAIKFDSPGPLLYSSERIGRKGRVFRCLKFRTLAFDGEIWQDEMLRIDERNSVLIKKTSAIHLTPLGRLLRKYSLDELPQFINVFLGDMSIVGPRPPLARRIKDNEVNRLRRLDVTPGITGLWQVQTRKDSSLDNPKSIEENYAENCNVWFKTILRMIACVSPFKRKRNIK